MEIQEGNKNTVQIVMCSYLNDASNKLCLFIAGPIFSSIIYVIKNWAFRQ
jgi:hypothetical protein